jgi:hypothetical protein
MLPWQPKAFILSNKRWKGCGYICYKAAHTYILHAPAARANFTCGTGTHPLMRLIHTTDVKLVEFREEPEALNYATLSHRWSPDEVSFQQFNEVSRTQYAGTGMSKILHACLVAAKRRHTWLWVDTCCIDKTNSTEFSEAINSMWRIYRHASECFVYLADVPSVRRSEDGHFLDADVAVLEKSDWWNRGWTLQELLAPRDVTFFDAQWRPFGTKADTAREIARITGIRRRFLVGMEPLENASVAMRMSWAARRTTTKREDMAYCLLGLFDVHIPPLYGEGEKAFMRLQLEIIKKSSDESIFAWKADIESSGLLASSPSYFEGSGNIVSFEIDGHQSLPYSMTNQGLELRLPSNWYVPEEAPQPRNAAGGGNRPRGSSTGRKPLPRVKAASTMLHNGYTPVRFQRRAVGPIKDQSKYFYLTCGSSESVPHGCSTEKLLAVARKNVIRLTLQLKGSTWQRVQCNSLDEKESYPAGGSQAGDFAIFYVKQQGL